MKKQWNNPTMAQLNISATQNGPLTTTKYDMTTYDSDGKWWGGGLSNNK